MPNNSITDNPNYIGILSDNLQDSHMLAEHYLNQLNQVPQPGKQNQRQFLLYDHPTQEATFIISYIDDKKLPQQRGDTSPVTHCTIQGISGKSKKRFTLNTSNLKLQVEQLDNIFKYLNLNEPSTNIKLRLRRLLRRSSSSENLPTLFTVETELNVPPILNMNIVRQGQIKSEENAKLLQLPSSKENSGLDSDITKSRSKTPKI